MIYATRGTRNDAAHDRVRDTIRGTAMRFARCLVLTGLAATAMTAVVGTAAPPGVLARIAQGQWQLKEVDGSASRALCVGDPAAMLQVVHPRAQCTRAVMESGPSALTVHYTCPGAGHGRTTLTLRGSNSLRIQTQGMVAGAPFDYDFDARRTGDCALTGQ